MYDGDWLVRLSKFIHQRNPSGQRPWQMPLNVWGLGITSLLTDVSSEMVISILPAYLVLTGGFAPLVLGLATGLHEGGPLLATWIGGLIADRSGHRKLTAGAGYSISAISRLGWLTMASPGAGSVGALMLGDRLGKSIRTAPRDAMISLSVSADRLATAFGVHRALDAAGAALGPILAFVILWQLPRRYDVIFFTSFVVAVLGVVALVLFVDENQERRTSNRPADWRWSDALAVFSDSSFRHVLILAAAFGLATVSDAFIYLLLIQRSHANPYWMPLLYTGTAIGFLTMAVPVGYFADRTGRRRIFILGHCALLLAYLSAFSGASLWPWNGFVCVAFLGLFYASSEGVLAGLAGSLLPADSRSIGLAWVATALSGARLFSALLFGLVWTRRGDLTAISVFAAALIIVIVGFGFSKWQLNGPLTA